PHPARAAPGRGARADYLTQTVGLDQSNVLPDGVKYGSVRVEAYDGVGAPGGGLSAGQVRITVTADSLASYGKLDNFGIQKVGFNTDLSLKAGQITPPSGWKVEPGGNISGFGHFTWEVVGKGSNRHDPAVITISGLGANATPN